MHPAELLADAFVVRRAAIAFHRVSALSSSGSRLTPSRRSETVGVGAWFGHLRSAINALGEVTEFRRLLGRPDYLLRVNVADMAAYEFFIINRLSHVPGLKSIESHQTMKLVKGVP